MDHFKFSLYGNTITPSQDRKALKWQQMFIDQFNYDPNEHYDLSIHDNDVPRRCARHPRHPPRR